MRNKKKNQYYFHALTATMIVHMIPPVLPLSFASFEKIFFFQKFPKKFDRMMSQNVRKSKHHQKKVRRNTEISEVLTKRSRYVCPYKI